MDNTPKPGSKTGKILKLLLKIAVTVVCLWYVSGKIDFGKAFSALRSANWLFLFLALIAFALSKLFAAYRLNIYFRNINIRLTEWDNIKLYWLGMFYNLFLPGSITGDAYKVILLTKKYGVPYKKTSSAVLLDRFSGLVGLGLILAVYSVLALSHSAFTLLIVGSVGGALAGSILLFLAVRYWLQDFRFSFWITLFWGIAVQAMQVICIYMILLALGLPLHQHQYIFLFLLSSVVAVLPLTVGGLGIREIVFLEGSLHFGLQQENAVLISLLFYLITLLTSSLGLIYVFKQPLKTKKDPNESLNL